MVGDIYECIYSQSIMYTVYVLRHSYHSCTGFLHVYRYVRTKLKDLISTTSVRAVP